MKERQQNSNVSCKEEYNIPRRLTIFSVDSWRNIWSLWPFNYFVNEPALVDQIQHISTSSVWNFGAKSQSSVDAKNGERSCIHHLICNITRTGFVGSLLSYAFILFVRNLKQRIYKQYLWTTTVTFAVPADSQSDTFDLNTTTTYYQWHLTVIDICPTLLKNFSTRSK